jgi:hypothetical protein
MVQDNRPPPGTPPKYIYIRTKAKRYLEVGPAAYREGDALHMPPASMDEDILKKVESGMRQIIEWRGITPQTAFTGINIDGFYAMMSVLHFKLSSQATVACDKPNCILDEMTMQHAVTGEQIVLYNEVVHEWMGKERKKRV